MAWFLQKCGFLVTILVRNKGGDDTISSIEKRLENIKLTGIEMINRHENDNVTQDDQRFLSMNVFQKNLSRDRSDYKLGDLPKTGYVVADRQNYAFQRDLPGLISKCQSATREYPLALLADEDDECVSSYTGDHTRTEKIANQNTNEENRANITNRRLHEDTIELSDFFRNNTFRKACKLVVSVTATAYPLIHNGLDQDAKLNVLKKDNTKYPNYHGWFSPGEYKINKKIVADQVQGGSLQQTHDPMFTEMMNDAIENYKSDLFPHVNMVLASNEWSQIEKQDKLHLEFAQVYGNAVPTFTFSFNSKKNLLISLNITSLLGQPNVGELYHKIQQLSDNIRHTFGQLDTLTSQTDPSTNVVSWEFCLKSKIELSTCYDTIIYIKEYLGISKLLVVCVSGQCSNRGYTYKDRFHTTYVTHMLAEFNPSHKSTSYSMMIQKVGRICGRDNSPQVPRTIYMTQENHTMVERALNDNKAFIDLCVQHPNKTVREILRWANENQLDMVQNIVLRNVSWHGTKRYNEKANEEMKRKIPRVYMDQVFETPRQPTPPRSPELQSSSSDEGNQRLHVPLREFQQAFEHDIDQFADIIQALEVSNRENYERQLHIFHCTMGSNDNSFKSIIRHLVDFSGRRANLNQWMQIQPSKMTGLDPEQCIDVATFRNMSNYQRNHSWRWRFAQGQVIKVRGGRGNWQFKLSWR